MEGEKWRIKERRRYGAREEEDKGDRQRTTKKKSIKGGGGARGREERESISGWTAADLSWRDMRRTSGP